MCEQSEARRRWASVALVASAVAGCALILAGLGIPGASVLIATPIAALRLLRTARTPSPSPLGDRHLGTHDERDDGQPGRRRGGETRSGAACRAALVAVAMVTLLLVKRADATAWVEALLAPAAGALLLLRDRRFPRLLPSDGRRDARAMKIFGIFIGALTAFALLLEASSDHLH